MDPENTPSPSDVSNAEDILARLDALEEPGIFLLVPQEYRSREFAKTFLLGYASRIHDEDAEDKLNKALDTVKLVAGYYKPGASENEELAVWLGPWQQAYRELKGLDGSKTYSELNIDPLIDDKVFVMDLHSADGMFVATKHLVARHSGIYGTVKAFVPGHGGDVLFVENDKYGTTGSYSVKELAPLPAESSV